MTPDGRYVIFASGATNLVAGDTSGLRDVFIRDLVSSTTVLVSTNSKKATRSFPFQAVVTAGSSGCDA